MTKELEAARERLEQAIHCAGGFAKDDGPVVVRIADLRTLLDAKGEVVAWRWRFTGEAYGVEGALPGGWRHQDEKPEFRASEAWKREVQPLYAHTGGGDE